MINWLVNKLFWYTPLRKAIFDEVHFYDMIDKVLEDKTPGSLFWDESDGWRSWTYNESQNKYYFNDVPEDGLMDAMEYSFKSIE